MHTHQLCRACQNISVHFMKTKCAPVVSTKCYFHKLMGTPKYQCSSNKHKDMNQLMLNKHYHSSDSTTNINFKGQSGGKAFTMSSRNDQQSLENM